MSWEAGWGTGCAPDPHGQAAAGSFRRAIAVTGEMAAGEVEKAVRSMGLEDCIEVFPVKNVFFGDTVTAAGLLTGQDVISAVLRRWRKHDLRSFDVVLIPEVALFEGAFLDNCTLRDVAEATGVRLWRQTSTLESQANSGGQGE